MLTAQTGNIIIQPCTCDSVGNNCSRVRLGTPETYSIFGYMLFLFLQYIFQGRNMDLPIWSLNVIILIKLKKIILHVSKNSNWSHNFVGYHWRKCQIWKFRLLTFTCLDLSKFWISVKDTRLSCTIIGFYCIPQKLILSCNNWHAWKGDYECLEITKLKKTR